MKRWAITDGLILRFYHKNHICLLQHIWLFQWLATIPFNNEFVLVSMSLTFRLYPVYNSKKGLAQAKKNKHNTAFPPPLPLLYCAPIPFITPLSPVLRFFASSFRIPFLFRSAFFFVCVASSEYNSFFRIQTQSEATPSSVQPALPTYRPLGCCRGYFCHRRKLYSHIADYLFGKWSILEWGAHVYIERVSCGTLFLALFFLIFSLPFPFVSPPVWPI